MLTIRTRTLGLLPACVALFASAAAGSEITGAFGIELGKELPAGVTILEEEQVEPFALGRIKTTRYAIVPPRAKDDFDKVYVILAPISRRVYEIYATTPDLPRAQCHALKDGLDATLSKKYASALRARSPYGEVSLFGIGPHRNISMNCMDVPFGAVNWVWLTYTDSDLAETVIEEQRKLDAAAIDASTIEDNGL
jgi:hypothetical protein